MFACVRNDKADIALVPIENSQAGRVADTQRLIPDSDLNINKWQHNSLKSRRD